MLNLQSKLRHLFNNSKVTKEQVLRFIKSDFPPGEFNKAINTYPILTKIKLSNAFFPSIDDIRQKNAYFYTGDLKKELSWILFNIKKDSLLINEFVLLKEGFEECIFLANYDNAVAILADIKKKFGESLWTIEMTLLLKEYQVDTKENWETLTFFLNKLNSPFYKFLTSFYSKRIEKGMSIENCFNQFQSDFEGINGDSIVNDFFVLKSIYFADYDYDDLVGVIYICNIFGLIDQYLIVIDLIVKILSFTEQHDGVILQFIKHIEPIIFNDVRLKNIVNVISTDTNLLPQKRNNEILLIIDKYTSGFYDETIELCVDNFTKYPTCFEIFEIYVKSLIIAKRGFKEVNAGITINSILENMYKVLSCNDESEAANDNLLKLSLTFTSFDIGKQIAVFAGNQQGLPNIKNLSIISCLSSSISTPLLLSLDLGGRTQNINVKYKILEAHPSILVNLYISNKPFNTKIFETLKFGQKSIYTVRHFFASKNYTACVALIDTIDMPSIAPFYQDILLIYKYESLVELKDLITAIQLVGAIISNNEFKVTKLNITKLTDIVKALETDMYSEYIETSIVLSQVLQGYDLYEYFAEYMATQNSEYPSKLNINQLIRESSLQKVVYFLKKVCVVSTIQHSMEFDSIDKAEQERFEICILLKEIDNINVGSYDFEMNEIIRAGAVRKAIKEVNQGRIYVNIESLKKIQSKGLKESFNRFKEIEKVSKETYIIGFNSSKERNWGTAVINDLNPTDNNINDSYNNPAFLAFKSIYLETREKFLYSKEYGLDSSLSTRIRHGALKNHLRSVFEKLNLITSKDGDIYVDNQTWAEQLNFDWQINSEVQLHLKNFSRKIDDYTAYIVDSLIQIQTERNTLKKEGLFNYSTNDEVLFNYMSENRSRMITENDVIEILYQELSNITSLRLSISIYEKITTEIKVTFQNIIEELIASIRPLYLPLHCDLLNNIIKSSTNIQSELEIIGEWFDFTTIDSSSFLDIQTILTASKEYTNKINPNCPLEPTIILNCPPFYGYSHLLYVFNILMTNIIKHSQLEAHELKTEITVNRIVDYVEITIKNNISTEVNISEVHNKLSKVKENWNNHDNIERSNVEGQSGFDKIKRILLYEAVAKTDKFEFLVEDDSVSISLYFPYKELNHDDINN